jgi:hypothetical protein
MKTFQKITLAAAISAAPFMAQAELTPMDDALMGDTTGQAGVTIEIDIAATGVKIGEIEYADVSSTDTTGGSVLLQNVHITNADITQTIDVKEDGSLKLGMSQITDLTVNIGNYGGTTNDASAVALRSNDGLSTTEVINDIHLVADMGQSDTYLVNLANAANITDYGITQSFDNGTDLASSAATGSLAIQANVSIDINDLDVGMFGYTEKQANLKVATGIANSAAGGVATDYLDADGILDAANAAVVASGGVATAEELTDGSAIQLNNIQFYDYEADGTTRKNAEIKQTIWAQGGTVAQGGGVYIAIDSIKGTLDVGEIVIGQQSIGQVKVSGIDLAGMTQRIYGH